MKPKHQRLVFIAVSMLFLIGAALLTMRAFRDNLVFFYSPSELAQHDVRPDRLVRIGGLVKEGSLRRQGDETRFLLTDNDTDIEVICHGVLPPLFREGQGVVAEGYHTQGVFEAKRVLTKHDERYMPRDVVEALKKSGRWQESR